MGLKCLFQVSRPFHRRPTATSALYELVDCFSDAPPLVEREPLEFLEARLAQKPVVGDPLLS